MTQKKPAASQNGNTSRHKTTEPSTARLPIGVRAQFDRQAARRSELTGIPITGHALLVEVLTTAVAAMLAAEINQTGETPPGVAIVKNAAGDIEVLTYGPPMK